MLSIYIFFNRDGSIKQTKKIDDVTLQEFEASQLLVPRGRFGQAIKNIGDIDGNGYNDIVVSAPASSGYMGSSGVLFILFLGADGAVEDVSVIDDLSEGLQLKTGDLYGSAIENLGDFNNDGFFDIAVGAFGALGQSGANERVYIHLLDNNLAIKGGYTLSKSTANGAGALGLDFDDDYGSAIENLGDINGDGITDIAIGAFSDEGVNKDSGAWYIHLMNNDGGVNQTFKFDGATKNGPKKNELRPDDNYGSAIALLGDIDSNGSIEIAVGASGDEGYMQDSGAVYIHSLDFSSLAPAPENTNVELNPIEQSQITERSVPEPNEDEITKKKDCKSDISEKHLRVIIEDTDVTFLDVPSDTWFYCHVSNVVHHKIASGYKDANGNYTGRFGPANFVTYAELLKMTFQVRGITPIKNIEPKNPTAKNHWASSLVATAEMQGLSIFTGEVDINANATRADVAVMITESLSSRFADMNVVTYSDVPRQHKNFESIAEATSRGWIQGDGNSDTFRPSDNINRAEVSKILSTMIE